jgi:hypothetical protein
LKDAMVDMLKFRCIRREVRVCEVMDLPEEIELRRDRDVLDPGVAIAKLKTLIVKLFVTGCHSQGVMYQVIPTFAGTHSGY